jgi:hypothetical protein
MFTFSDTIATGIGRRSIQSQSGKRRAEMPELCPAKFHKSFVSAFFSNAMKHRHQLGTKDCTTHYNGTTHKLT